MALLKRPQAGTLGGGMVTPSVDLGVSGGAARGGSVKGAPPPTFDTTYGSAFAGRQFVNPKTASPTGAPSTAVVPPPQPAILNDAMGRKKGIYGKPGT